MKENKTVFKIQEIIIFILTAAVSGVAAWLYGNNIYEMVRIVILIMIAAGSLFFVIEISKERKLFVYDNEENFHRFTEFYLFFLVASVALPLLPEGGWPFLVIFISLMLLGN